MLPLLLLLTGCATGFREDHYFKAVGEDPNAPANYFRLRISGNAQFSSARYIAGFYDERAVDLFFDEMKSASSQDAAKSESIFQGGEIPLAGGQKIAPLSPTPENGAFLMIFSTNAKAVANTIGEFADSQVVADALTNLVNTGEIREAANEEASLKMTELRGKSVAAEIESLVGALPPSTEVNPAKGVSTEGALRILSAIAQSLGRPGSFASIDEARGWFQARTGGLS
ncbi:MAG TPA: hypothetical protein VEG34_00090 [Thermoanaerobaculia bacterium]|nr:hypothetical protein [Thermoanaerobaculia bacterium]